MMRLFILVLTLCLSTSVAFAQRLALTGPLDVAAHTPEALQPLLDRLAQDYDTRGYDIHLWLAPIAYPGVTVRGLLGGGTLYVRGTLGATALRGVNRPGITVVDRATVILAGVSVASAGPVQAPALLVANYSTVIVPWGLILEGASGEHLAAHTFSTLFVPADYTVLSGGVSHLHAFGSGAVVVTGHATFAPGVVFSAYVFGAAHAELRFSGGHTGSVQAPKPCSIHGGSLLFVGGPWEISRLPGGPCAPDDLASVVE